jgi:large subunit ribosomal protein L6
MSRIGRKPITVPEKVKIALKDQTITVTGPLGTLSFTAKPEVQMAFSETDKSVVVSIDEAKHGDNRSVRALFGTTRSLINGMVIGVTKGFSKSLEVVGVGYTASVTGNQLKLVVGFANPILVAIPAGVKCVVEKQFINISGADKQAVGMLASKIRSHRKPEPYQGKGIKYTTETIKRKSGKAFGAA